MAIEPPHSRRSSYWVPRSTRSSGRAYKKRPITWRALFTVKPTAILSRRRNSTRRPHPNIKKIWIATLRDRESSARIPFDRFGGPEQVPQFCITGRQLTAVINSQRCILVEALRERRRLAVRDEAARRMHLRRA